MCSYSSQVQCCDELERVKIVMLSISKTGLKMKKKLENFNLTW